MCIHTFVYIANILLQIKYKADKQKARRECVSWQVIQYTYIAVEINKNLMYTLIEINLPVLCKISHLQRLVVVLLISSHLQDIFKSVDIFLFYS
jgi:hypothetical protein